MTLIRLTQLTLVYKKEPRPEGALYVNPEAIAAIAADNSPDKLTHLVLSSGFVYYVKESPETILGLMKARDLDTDPFNDDLK